MFEKLMKPDVVRQLRENAGLTRKDAALMMGWSEGTQVNYETKECKMKFSEFDKYLLVTTSSKEERERRKALLRNIDSKMQELLGTQ